jgi:hypothetical protein
MGREARQALNSGVWRPQAGPQKALVDCPVEGVFFGGSRGHRPDILTAIYSHKRNVA